MLDLGNNNYLIQDASEFPTSFIGADNVYLDFETSSGSKDLDSLNPWHNCSIAGFGITVDMCPQAYYFDYKRSEQKAAAIQFLQDVLHYAATWTNHNVKYDAHVAINNGIVIPPWLELVCTIVKAKLIDSDRITRGGYGLDNLAGNWLGLDITRFEKALQPWLKNNKDYGAIPSDIIGEYGCIDVQANRLIDKHIDAKLPESSKQVALTEIKLTKELVKMEQRGMRYDPTKLQVAQFITLNRISKLDDELAKIVGRSFKPNSPDDCYSVLCGQYGLPIIKYTVDSDGEETDNASFDKKVLAAYKATPYAPHDVIDRIIEFRKLSQRNSLFFKPWQELAPDGIIHPTFNQAVRTGRMSCSEPNMQQLDDFVAGLIEPRPGYSIISCDASQIEYRMIVDYINNARCIQAYNENPDTDFHDYIAELVKSVADVKIGRKPAKTLNFQHGFGAGKTSVINAIAANDDIIKAVKEKVNAINLPTEELKVQAFKRLVTEVGSTIYDAYHKALPELKPTAKAAESACKDISRRLGTAPSANGIRHWYGYIENRYGRRRHLPYAEYRTDFKTKDPYDRAWLAFPTVNSSTAADLMKERFVSVMRDCVQDLPIYGLCLVHDECVWEAPTELASDPRTARDLIATLESPTVKFKIPIRWSIGVSEKNWLDASNEVAKGGKSGMLQYNKAEAQQLDWARNQG